MAELESRAMSKPKLFVVTIERTLVVLAKDGNEACDIAVHAEPNKIEEELTSCTPIYSLEDLDHEGLRDLWDTLPYGDQESYWGNQSAEKYIKQLFDEYAVETK